MQFLKKKKSLYWVFHGMWVLSGFSCVWLFGALWTRACQAPLSMRFSRQECWSGLLCPPPGDLLDPGMELMSLMYLHWQAGSLPPVPLGKESEVSQSCPTLCNPMDCTPPDAFIHGIFQARKLDWVDNTWEDPIFSESSVNIICSVLGLPRWLRG